MKNLLEDLSKPPVGDRSYFSDWGDPREYTLGDMGQGECAGDPEDDVVAGARRVVYTSFLAAACAH